MTRPDVQSIDCEVEEMLLVRIADPDAAKTAAEAFLRSSDGSRAGWYVEEDSKIDIRLGEYQTWRWMPGGHWGYRIMLVPAAPLSRGSFWAYMATAVVRQGELGGVFAA